MNAKDAIVRELRNLALDRTAVRLMEEDIAGKTLLRRVG